MKKSSKIILIIAIILFIAGAGIGVFFGIQSKQDCDKKIAELENKIVEFISSLDSQHLKSIIYMSLDMDVNVNNGIFDKLME